jgi:hypothetical protein
MPRTHTFPRLQWYAQMPKKYARLVRREVIILQTLVLQNTTANATLQIQNSQAAQVSTDHQFFNQ